MPSLPPIPHFDKVLHAGVYGVLGLLVYRAFRILSRSGWTAAQRTLIVCALYALTDEAHQSFIPGRSAELGDWFADVFGACICLLWARYDERLQKINTSPPS